MGIESLCRRDWLHAIALFRQALLEFQHEMNVSTTTSSSSIAAAAAAAAAAATTTTTLLFASCPIQTTTSTPTSTTQIVETKTVMYISSIRVGPLFDLYQTAYSFQRQQQQQVMILVPNIASVAAAAAVGVKATTTTTTTHSLYINTTTKNNHEMISSILLYNLGLANHLMGIADQSRMTPALQCSQRLYYLALQGVMGGGFNSHENNNNNNNHHHNNQGVMKEEENYEPLVTPTSASASSVSMIGTMLHENEDVNKSRNSSSGGGIDNGVSYYGEERKVLMLAIISNLRHIHQSFYDYDDIMFTTNLLQIVWQEFVEYEHCRSSERLDDGVVVVNNDTPPLTRDGRILLSPTIAHRMKQVLLPDDDVIYFLLSLLLESEPFINGAASA
jgi:hypothetical protein